MATVFDRVGMSTTTTGTGALTLGSALGNVSPNLAAFVSFASAGIANGQLVSYLILDANNNWEVGIGTYTSAGTLLSRTPLWSNNSNAAINLSGNAQVFITEIAEDVNQAGFGGYRNRFRNAAMDIWQRGTSAITVTTAGAYAADGWIVVPSGASCTVQQSGPESDQVGYYGVYNALQVKGATGVTDILVKQRIESNIGVALASQTVTFQMAIENDTGGPITPALTVKHATAGQDNWSISTTDVNAASLGSVASGADVVLAYTFACPFGAYQGLEISVDFGNNFSTTGKSIQIFGADIRVTPGVAVGLNNNPPPVELRPLPTELLACQRYFTQLAPSGNSGPFGAGHFDSTTSFHAAVPLPAPMRGTQSSLSATFSAAGNFQVRSGGTNFAVSAISVSQSTPTMLDIVATVGGQRPATPASCAMPARTTAISSSVRNFS